MTSTITRPRTRVEQDLDKFNLPWTRDMNYTLSHLSADRQIQIRDDENLLDQERCMAMVNSFRETEPGVPPTDPMLVAGTGEKHTILDGNGRFAAYTDLGWPVVTCGATVVLLDWATCTDVQRDQMSIVAARANVGPKQHTAKELRRIVVKAISQGVLDTDIIRMFGYSPVKVTTIKRELAQEARMHNLCLTATRYQGIIKTLLTAANGLRLNTEPAQRFAELVFTNGMREPDAREFRDELVEMASDKAQIRAIAAKDDALNPPVVTPPVQPRPPVASPARPVTVTPLPPVPVTPVTFTPAEKPQAKTPVPVTPVPLAKPQVQPETVPVFAVASEASKLIPLFKALLKAGEIGSVNLVETDADKAEYYLTLVQEVNTLTAQILAASGK